jgi:hypothetical protein
LAVGRQLSCGGLRCAGLFLPSLGVHSDHQEPQGQRSFPKDAGGQIVGGHIVCERRREKGQPTQTANRHQHAQNSRKEGRPENEVADQEAVESEKYQVVDVEGGRDERG